MRDLKGFSIIELLVAAAIILVICAIAVPGFLRSRVAANESLALVSMKEIDNAEIAYAAAYPEVGFAATLNQLGPPPANAKASAKAAGFLDSELGCAHQPCMRAGYGFSIVGASRKPVATYRSIAMPIRPGITGGRGFCDDQTHRLFADPDGNSECTQPVR